ncbi:MAG: glycosyltransferase family 4 protein, partial [Bifidobacteriaceae bacterium]|nr:glycosyltransferase family 4 protein [Bifidobacteriaceae bacterium]
RIVHLCGPSDGGIRAHVRTLAGAQRTAGHRVGLVDWPAHRRVARASLAADVVHAHGLKAGALAVLATRAVPASGRPAVVVTLHNLPVGPRRVRAAGALLARVVARAHAVLAVSDDIVAWATHHGARHARWTPVPAPALDLPHHSRDEVRASLGVPPDCALVLTVGRLAPQKGLDLAIDTAVYLRTACARGLTWVIAGEGPQRAHIAERIDREAVPLRLLGRRDDLPDLYHAADLVVSTAVWEGQPLALQEALASGVPVVATDAGGTRGVVGAAGLLVARDPRAVAGAIVRVLESPEYLADLRIRARRRGRELPTVHDMLADVMASYPASSADG